MTSIYLKPIVEKLQREHEGFQPCTLMWPLVRNKSLKNQTSLYFRSSVKVQGVICHNPLPLLSNLYKIVHKITYKVRDETHTLKIGSKAAGLFKYV